MNWIDLLTAHIDAMKKPKFFKSTLIAYGMGDRKLSSDSDKDSLSAVQLPV